MRTIVAVAVMTLVVSIVAFSTLVVADNIDARTKESQNKAAGSSGSESAGSEIYTAVCGPDAVHACQRSTGQ